jgi:dihydrofolate synthase/folylpolyglutamate synthase
MPEQYTLKTQSRDGIIFEFEGTELQIPYIAEYQMMNASLAYFTMKTLQEEHGICDEKLKEGIKNVTWPGRMETILPGVIVDGAHNADGVAQFVKTVHQFRQSNRVVLLFSAVSDKEYDKMIQLICEDIKPHAVVTTQITGERQVTAEVLTGLFREYGAENVFSVPEVKGALDKALELQQDGMVFCVGSLYLIGEIKASLQK